MPRFNYDLVGARTVLDRQGLIFEDCQIAGRFADRLASDLGVVRPELRETACVMMTDEFRNELTYCVSIHAPAGGAATPAAGK
jgi:hypothetical protein